MREALAALDGQRLTVRATVLRFSRCIGWAGVRQPTILLGQVTCVDGEALADHIWLHLGKRMADLDLKLGDLVEFSARVAQYRRSLFRLPGEPMTFNTDYGLAYPTHCRLIAHKPLIEEPAAPTGPATLRPSLVARSRMISTIGRLWEESGEPPTLPNVFSSAAVAPATFFSQMHKLAKAGTVVFQPNGRVFLTAIPIPPIHQEVRA
jgi:hypothetical protein